MCTHTHAVITWLPKNFAIPNSPMKKKIQSKKPTCQNCVIKINYIQEDLIDKAYPRGLGYTIYPIKITRINCKKTSQL